MSELAPEPEDEESGEVAPASMGRDAMVVGLVVVFAIVGGITAALNQCSTPAEVPPADAPAEESRIVPNLPPVPDLSRDRPTAPAADNERVARLGAEMRLLSEARAALDGRPQEALSLLHDHRERFPDGAFVEERDAYLVEVLVALRRTDEAERRFYDFRRAFPESPLGARLESLLATRTLAESDPVL